MRLSEVLTKFSPEPSSHELRQAVAVAAPVLQEGDHEEDGAEPEAGLSVLSPLPPLDPILGPVVVSDP